MLKTERIFQNCLILVVMIYGTGTFAQIGESIHEHPATDQNSSWKLAVQLWTFKNITFLESLERTASLGLSWVEAYPGQKFSPDDQELIFDHDLPQVYREQVKKRLRKLGLRLINYGVVELTDDEEDCKEIFEFAKDMGIRTIISEPEMDALPMIDSLCHIYDIRVALHNHPKPSRYWNPDTVLKACQGFSNAIGVCGDIGHWMRSGVHPLEAVKKLSGRLATLHLKDLTNFERPSAKDVPVGKGSADIDLLLQELMRQGFSGVFALEHENNWDNNLPYLRTSIENFNHISRNFKEVEWVIMLDRKLTQFMFKKDTWVLEDDKLVAKGGDDIWSKNRFGNFILDLQFRIGSGGNSGVFIRTGDVKEWLHTAIEVQILDSFGKEKPEKFDCGAIFDCLEPSVNAVNKSGEWNRYTITCIDNKIYVVLNGQQVVDMDLNKWTTAHLNPDGTANKFNHAYKDMPREGNIGLQYHGDPVMFRNIKLRSL